MNCAQILKFTYLKTLQIIFIIELINVKNVLLINRFKNYVL